MTRYRRIHGPDTGADVEDELGYHLEMRTRDLIAQGMTEEAAGREARQRFGDVEAVAAHCRAEGARLEDRRRRGDMFAAWLQDVRFGLRTMAKAPGFTLVAVLTLALGIGAATALFSTVDHLLLRPLPLKEPDRLVTVLRSAGEGRLLTGLQRVHLEEVASAPVVEAASGSATYEFSLRGEGPAEAVNGLFVTPSWFGVLGVAPAAGRFFMNEDERSPQVVVISHRLWRRSFASDAAVVGRTITLNGNPVTVIGVAPRGHATTRIGTAAPDVWLPDAARPQFEPARADGTTRVLDTWPLVRLRPDVTLEHAKKVMEASMPWATEDLHGMTSDGFQVRPLDPIGWTDRDRVHGFARLLSGATLLLLLIAGINVAGMLLARATGRRREIGIRLAVGAGRGRIVRQLLVEGVLLFLAGGAAGVLFAYWLTNLVTMVPWTTPVEFEPALDARVLGFALLVSLVAGVGFTLVPALQTTRVDVLPALRSGGNSRGAGRSLLRSTVVVLQVALSLVLLVSAALFVRALETAWKTDPGFDPDGVSVAVFNLGLHGYATPAAMEFYDRLLERVSAAPGVTAAALATEAPFQPGGLSMMIIEPEGWVPDAAQPFAFGQFSAVTSDYFRTLGMRIVEGRELSASDGSGAPRVAVVTERFARKYWPNESAVGKRLGSGTKAVTIVGVLRNAHTRSLQPGSEHEMMFLPAAQTPNAAMTLHVRTQGREAVALPAIRSIVRQMDPALPPVSFVPLNHWIGLTLLPQRIGAWMVGGFGLFGLLLAMIGLYGLLSFGVLQRTREIGIRLALGARAHDVVAGVVRQGVLLTLGGTVLGLTAAVAATRVLANLLYGVSPLDIAVFAIVPLALIAVGVIASLIPARRATRVAPMAALRSE